MSDERAGVVIIGLGAMGAAACFHLARRGADVAGFDRFDVPNALGSSGGESRMIRMCYYEHPDYVPLLRRAYGLWRELAHETNQPVLEITGGLFIGRPDGPLVAGSRRAALEHGLAHEMLSHADLGRRVPQFTVDAGMVGLFEPTAGFVRPEMAISAHARLAAQHGARLHADEPVRAWHAIDNGVVVETDARRVRCDVLIVCAGPWTSRLVSNLGAALTVTRQTVAWVALPDPKPFGLGAFPVWAMEHTGRGFHYGFPILDASRGLKLARHAPGATTDPDGLTRTAAPGDEAEIRPFLRRYLPAADGPLREMAVCMYTRSPDSHFIVDRHRAHERVYLACGFSGHGFKFAPVIGEALADLALSGSTRLPIDFLSLSRFG